MSEVKMSEGDPGPDVTLRMREMTGCCTGPHWPHTGWAGESEGEGAALGLAMPCGLDWTAR
jgi:hypothetical protein